MSFPSERRTQAENVIKRVETKHAIAAQRVSALGLEAGAEACGEQRPASKLQSQPCLRFLSKVSEQVMSLIIILNMVVVVMEVDRSASNDESTGDMHWEELLGWVILVIFLVELVVRLQIYRRHFFSDPWNVADFFLVSADAIFTLIALIGGSFFPMSVLRIFRLAKLARISKVLRIFPQIRVLLIGLLRSMSAIFWGSCLLFLTVILWAMVAVMFIHPLSKDMHFEQCNRCPYAYSSVMASSLTFWKNLIAGDSWGETAIPMMERHPATICFFLPCFVTIGMAVMNLIVGVVVLAAQQASDDVKQEEFEERVLSKKEMQHKLLEQCRNMDKDGDGELDKLEIYQGFDEPTEFRKTLDKLDIHREDLEIVWALMDADKSGTVSYKEMVHSLYTMTSSDQRFMLAYIKYYTTVIKDVIIDKLDLLGKEEEEEINLLKQTKADIYIEQANQGWTRVADQGQANQEQDVQHDLPLKVPSTTSVARSAHSARGGPSDELLPSITKLSNEFLVLRDELKSGFVDINSKLAAVSLDLDATAGKRPGDGLAVIPNTKPKSDNSCMYCDVAMPVEAHKVHTLPNNVPLPKSEAKPSDIRPLPRHWDLQT